MLIRLISKAAWFSNDNASSWILWPFYGHPLQIRTSCYITTTKLKSNFTDWQSFSFYSLTTAPSIGLCWQYYWPTPWISCASYLKLEFFLPDFDAILIWSPKHIGISNWVDNGHLEGSMIVGVDEFRPLVYYFWLPVPYFLTLILPIGGSFSSIWPWLLAKT
jgi:hypothetical protein